MTTDKLSKIDRGRLAYDLAHNAEFRRQLKTVRYTQRLDEALEEGERDREASKQATEQARAERKTGGSIASGRARFAERCPAKAAPAVPADDPLDDGLDHTRVGKYVISETERTGQRGLKAGRDRFKKTDTARGAAQGTYDVEGFDGE